MQDTIEQEKTEQEICNSTEEKYEYNDDIKSWDELEDNFNRVLKKRLKSRELLKSMIPSLALCLVSMSFVFGSLSFITASIVSPILAIGSLTVTGLLVETKDFDGLVSGMVTGFLSSAPLGLLAGLVPLSLLSSAFGGFPSALSSSALLWSHMTFSLSGVVGIMSILIGFIGILCMNVGERLDLG